jgi:hypothetical protein
MHRQCSHSEMIASNWYLPAPSPSRRCVMPIKPCDGSTPAPHDAFYNALYSLPPRSVRQMEISIMEGYLPRSSGGSKVGCGKGKATR